MALEQMAVRQFNCPNCGGGLTVYNQRTRYVGCQHCGAELDATQDPARVLLQLEGPGPYPPFTKLKLGMTAVIDGMQYVIVGRTRWHSDYLEFWREVDDGEVSTGYSREEWTYDEWVLFSTHYTHLYLIEDPEGFALSEELVPLEPVIPKNQHERINFMGGPEQRIREFGKSSVVYHEGESPYRISPGDTVRFAEYARGRDWFSVQWRLEGNSPVEVEFFVDHKLPDQAVAEAFGLLAGRPAGTKLAHLLPDFDESHSPEGVARKVAHGQRQWVNGLLILLAGLTALGVLMAVVGRGETLAEQRFDFTLTEGAIEETVPLGTVDFTLEHENDLIHIDLSADYTPDNSWLVIGTEVVREDSLPIRSFQGEFWQESGVDYECDEDGCGYYGWSENDLKAGLSARAGRTGPHVLRVFATPGQPATGSILVRITKQGPPWYLLGTSVLGSILGTVLLFRGRRKQKRWRPFLRERIL